MIQLLFRVVGRARSTTDEDKAEGCVKWRSHYGNGVGRKMNDREMCEYSVRHNGEGGLIVIFEAKPHVDWRKVIYPVGRLGHSSLIRPHSGIPSRGHEIRAMTHCYTVTGPARVGISRAPD